MTLVSSAHRNDLQVGTYINDVLRRLLAGDTNYEQMLPWNWAAENPHRVRKFRQEERRDRVDRRETARAKRRARKKLLETRHSQR